MGHHFIRLFVNVYTLDDDRENQNDDDKDGDDVDDDDDDDDDDNDGAPALIKMSWATTGRKVLQKPPPSTPGHNFTHETCF